MSSSADNPPLFKDSNGASDHGGDSGVAVDEAPKAATAAAADDSAAASLDGDFEERQHRGGGGGGGTHLIARVLGSPRKRKGKKIVVTAAPAAAPTAGGSSSSSPSVTASAALDYGHSNRRKSMVPQLGDWGMAMDFSTIFRRRERLSVKDSLAVVGLKKALLIGEQGTLEYTHSKMLLY